MSPWNQISEMVLRESEAGRNKILWPDETKIAFFFVPATVPAVRGAGCSIVVGVFSWDRGEWSRLGGKFEFLSDIFAFFSLYFIVSLFSISSHMQICSPAPCLPLASTSPLPSSITFLHVYFCPLSMFFPLFPTFPFLLAPVCILSLAWCRVCNRHLGSLLHAGRDFPKILQRAISPHLNVELHVCTCTCTCTQTHRQIVIKLHIHILYMCFSLSLSIYMYICIYKIYICMGTYSTYTCACHIRAYHLPR